MMDMSRSFKEMESMAGIKDVQWINEENRTVPFSPKSGKMLPKKFLKNFCYVKIICGYIGKHLWTFSSTM
jgi:hypothetical protein